MIKQSLMDCLKQIHPFEAGVFEKAQKEAEQSNVPLEKFLIQQEIVSNTDMALATAKYLDLRPISLNAFTPQHDLIDLIPKERWKEFKSLPICRTGTCLTLAMADPFDIMAIDLVKFLTQCNIKVVIAKRSDIEFAEGRAAREAQGHLDPFRVRMVEELHDPRIDG